LTLHLVEQEPDVALESLRKRETDLVVAHSYSLLLRNLPAGCEQHPLMDDPVLLAPHPEHAARLGVAPGQAVDLSRLSDAPWLTPARRPRATR
jgi:hypothetical protein